MLKVKVFVCSDFRQNTRVLWDNETKQAVCIDPGSRDSGVREFLANEKLTLTAIVLTHSHIDHYGGVATVLRGFPNTPLYGHLVEKTFRSNFAERLALWGIPPDNYEECPEPNHYISGGEEIELLRRKFQIFHTPGHSPGSVSLFCETEGILLSGDVLFRESVGRTDLPGGDLEALKTSVASLLKLPSATKVLSGHGPDTTIGHELKANPFA